MSSINNEKAMVLAILIAAGLAKKLKIPKSEYDIACDAAWENAQSKDKKEERA